MEKRKGALFDIDRTSLEKRMNMYLDPNIGWDELKREGHALTLDAASFDAESARRKILDKESFDEARIVRYLVRPFDVRYAYYTAVPSIWNRARPDLWAQLVRRNRFVVTRRFRAKEPEGSPLYFTRLLGDNSALSSSACYAPFQDHCPDELSDSTVTLSNLSEDARTWLRLLELPDPDEDAMVAQMPWLHFLAIAYSIRYRSENADGIGLDWPRFPLAESRFQLDKSVALGARVAASVRF